MTKKIIIVGGGITGLTAAYYLKKEIARQQIPYKVILLEANSQLGGKISTLHKDGFIIERGPDSFLARKQPGIALMEELGLTNRLIRNSTGQAYVFVDDTLHKIPAGSYMGIPVHEQPFLDSDIISDAGKKRALKELHLPVSKEASDQSLGKFFRNRFGDELVDHLLEPLLSGIYSGDIDQMSLMSTFSNFYELEQAYGSLLKGLRETMSSKQTNTGKKTGQFLALQGGLGSIVEALKKTLGDSCHTGTAVEHIKQKESGEGYLVTTANGTSYDAASVIAATPHQIIPNLFGYYSLFSPLKAIPVTSVANVALAFNKTAKLEGLDGTGFVVSRKTNCRITACTWTHKKWPHTTPEGKVLLRAYVGKPDDQDIVSYSDQTIKDIVMNDLHQIMGITEEPEFSVVTRWNEQMPQYMVGHREKIAAVTKSVHCELPGVFLAGASYDGVGLPDCIGQGEKAARDVLQFLRK